VLDGDPVVLQLPAGTRVDVDVVTRGTWGDAVQLPGLGSPLLDGMALRGAPVFDTWLLSQQRRLSAASEAILHEAALGSMSQGSLNSALGFAVRATAMSPLDENHQALLIRLYRLAGDDEAAVRQYAACRDLFMTELGVPPGRAVEAALRERRHQPDETADEVTIDALVEAGSAAISAGAVAAGLESLRTAVRLADRGDTVPLRGRARLALAEALIHSTRGLDEEGLASLYEADAMGREHNLPHLVAQTRAELGYVDFLRARYDRAEVWLEDALALGAPDASVQAKAATYLGSVDSDRARYPSAYSHLEQAIELSQRAGEPRRTAFALAMLGRLNLIRGDLEIAGAQLAAAVDLAERAGWLAFVPWPEALHGELQLERGDAAGASRLLEQAFARACQLGDPCWEGLSARGLGLVAEANGDVARAFEVLADARVRCNRLADPYVWLDVHILDAQCQLGRRHGHPDTARWVEAMHTLACRAGMKELVVRALLHAAGLGDGDAAESARLLAADIDNPVLTELVSAANLANLANLAGPASRSASPLA